MFTFHIGASGLDLPNLISVVTTHACNPSTREVEAGGSETQVTLGYIVCRGQIIIMLIKM